MHESTHVKRGRVVGRWGRGRGVELESNMLLSYLDSPGLRRPSVGCGKQQPQYVLLSRRFILDTMIRWRYVFFFGEHTKPLKDRMRVSRIFAEKLMDLPSQLFRCWKRKNNKVTRLRLFSPRMAIFFFLKFFMLMK